MGQGEGFLNTDFFEKVFIEGIKIRKKVFVDAVKDLASIPLPAYKPGVVENIQTLGKV